MGQVEEHLETEALSEIRVEKLREICDRLLDSSVLQDELEHNGVFAPSRKRFCEFMGVGESTLTGWLKEDRIPRAVRVAYVMTVAFTMLQRRLRDQIYEGEQPIIVPNGDSFLVVDRSEDDTGRAVGRIRERVSTMESAQVLAEIGRTRDVISNLRDVVADMVGRPEMPDDYIAQLNDLDERAEYAETGKRRTIEPAKLEDI